MQRIGIYGGAYNPPHTGHVLAAQYALNQLQLDKLLMIPSCVSPHKELPVGSADPWQRLQMLQLATAHIPGICVSDIELRRGDVSYTYETVAALREQYPDAELILLMGTDMFLSFEWWRYPEKILENASLGVFYRGDKGEKEKIQEKKDYFESQGARIYLVENPVTQISSTNLRRMLVMGGADEFLHPQVADFIRQQGLYRTGENFKNLSLSQLEQVVMALIDPKRVLHVQGCRQTALELAEIYGVDPVDAQRAALLHDITKALDGPLQLTLCREYGITLDDFSVQNPKTLHALTGSLVAERIFGENPGVVSAIACHTTGKENMNTLEKIIYLADYTEPNRDFLGAVFLRKQAYQNLDQAMITGLSMTLSVLEQQGSQVSPESRQALEYLKKHSEKRE